MVATATALLIAAGASVAGAGISAVGASKAGKAQKQTAEEQLAYAKQAEERARADRANAYNVAKSSTAQTPEQLMYNDKLLAAASASVDQQFKQIGEAQKVLDAVDPAMKEAGAETLRLLQGESAKILAPIQKQRNEQRLQLEQSLAERLGPGFRTTAAGIMAINNFDNETATTMTNANFAALNQVSSTLQGLGSLSNQTSSNITSIGQNIVNANQASKNANTQANLTAAQILAEPINTSGTQNAFNMNTQVAGNQYAGMIAAGQTLSNLGGNVGQSVLTNAIGNGGTPLTPVPVGSSLPGTPAPSLGQFSFDQYRLPPGTLGSVIGGR